MPKLKTNKTASKRFKVTGSGKLRRRKARATHLRKEKEQAGEEGIAAGCPCQSGRQKAREAHIGFAKPVVCDPMSFAARGPVLSRQVEWMAFFQWCGAGSWAPSSGSDVELELY